MKINRYTLPCFLLMLCTSLHAQDQKDTDADTTKAPAAKTIKYSNPVKGYISDAGSGKAITGARITYLDLAAAITDSTGKFSINIPGYQVTLRVDADGYQSKEIALKGKNNVVASLYESDFQSAYDNMVTPFDVISKSASTFAATSLQTGGNWNGSPEPPDAYLQGKVPGLNAIRRSGTPNMGANMFLRGFTSLYATNQPLVVVDGVYYDISAYGGSLINGFYNNPLSQIDIKDIENITVLKDGSSIYGSKGANGVLLISTSKAKQEATRIDMGLYGGVNFAPANIPVLNTDDYRIYLSEMLQSRGLSGKDINTLPYMNDDVNNPEYYRNHYDNNWQNKIFKGSSMQNGFLKITGGDNIAKLGLTIGFLRSGGVLRNTGLTRYNMRFNADLNLSKRLTASTNVSVLMNEQDLKDLSTSKSSNPIYAGLIKSPFFPANEVADNGVESPSFADKDTFNISNPSALANTALAYSKNYRFVASIGFKYVFNKNLSLSNTIAITLDKTRQSYFFPGKGIVNDTLDNAVVLNRSGAGVTRRFSLFNDVRINYNKVFNNIHQFSAHAGLRYIRSNFEDDNAFGYNSATDELTGVGYGVTALRQLGGDLVEWAWANAYFNADYNLLRKYFLSLNVAADGSSKFGSEASGSSVIRLGGKNYPVFPSLSGAWLVSSEQFMAGTNWIDLLKIRASIGMSGNDDIGNYTSKKYYVAQNLLGIGGLIRGNAANPDLQWESVTKLNAGIDIALFKERLNVSFDAYHNKTDKMLIFEPAPEATGMNYITTNSGGMKTTGWEASLNARIINGTDLKFDLGFNVAHYKSVITKLPVSNIYTEFAGATILTGIGNAPNLFYGYKTNGVYTSDAEAAAAGLGNKNIDGSSTPFKGGDVRFVNAAGGDKVIDENDRQVIGDPNPDFAGAVTGRLNWKSWTLDALFTFSQGNDVYNYTRRQLESMTGYENQTQAVINRWKTNGQVTNVPKATWGDPMGNSRFSDRWIEDGSYFRLRTVSLAYNLPIKPRALKYATIYLTGTNLFTLTKYLGYDPEFSGTSHVIGQGVDVMLEPQFRSVQLGVKLGL